MKGIPFSFQTLSSIGVRSLILCLIVKMEIVLYWESLLTPEHPSVPHPQSKCDLIGRIETLVILSNIQTQCTFQLF